MSRYYATQELIKLSKSGVLSEDCQNAIYQALDDINTMDKITDGDINIKNPYDIYNNNQGFNGFNKGIQATLDYIRGGLNE